MGAILSSLSIAVLAVVASLLIIEVGKGIAKALNELINGIKKIPNVFATPAQPLPKGPEPQIEIRPSPPIKQPEAEVKEEQPKEEPPESETPPPLPFIVPLGNTGSDGHQGKKDDEKEDCSKELEKYIVHPHIGRDDAANSRDNKQSHHVIQHAVFMDKNDMLGSGVQPPTCKTYSYDNAPCIALKGGTREPESPHGKATTMQRKHAAAADASGVPYTYGAARENAAKQLEAAELTSKEIRCVMAVVDAWIKVLCPNITDSTVVRIPWSKNNV